MTRSSRRTVAPGPDLVIVGGGPAGLAAAATATELGLTAVLLEKTERLGGQLHISAGRFSGAGTRLQARAGIDDDPALHFRDVMRLGEGRADPEILQRAVETAPGAVDWLEDLGFPFAEGSPGIVTYHEPYSRPRTYWGEAGDRPGGTALLDLFTGGSLLDGVDVRLETGVREVVIDSTGEGPVARGVVAEGPEGVGTITAAHVVLATGGYAADRKMIETFHPLQRDSLIACRDHATGDGHRMLMDLSVPMTHGDAYVPSMGLIADPARPGHAVPLPDAQVVVDAAERPPWEIWVNTRGERFVAEDHPSPAAREAALARQPAQTMFVVWDQAIARDAPPVMRGSSIGRTPVGRTGVPWLVSAPSLEGLAGECGIPAAALRATVARYNEFGADLLGRTHRPRPILEPPFFAVRCVGGLLVSWAGPRVDRDLRPVTGDRGPIQGLYAIGELLGMGQIAGRVLAGGMGIGPAVSLGRAVVEAIGAVGGGAPR